MERTLSKRNEFIVATLATLVFLPSIALADEAPCVTSTLSEYIAAGSAGCTFGGLAFSNFSYSSLQTSQFPASSATVIPVMGSHGVGFEFRSTWGCDVPEHENSCGFFDGTITYTVTGASINGQRLNFFESSPAMISDASVRETTQGGSSFVFAFGVGPNEHLTDSVTFNPMGQLLVSNTIDATNMKISGFNEEFTVTPEPGTIALFGSGLAALAALRKRRQHR